ncbi:MAG: hypothetical protein ABEN55_14745, partial [Bradymonadaceae bacterium]
ERIVSNMKLKEAADDHGVDVNLPYDDLEVQKEAAKERLDKRIEVMRGLDDYDAQAQYINEINKVKRRLTQMDDYRTLLKSAAQIEEADREHSLDAGWDQYYPGPVETFTKPKPEPLPPLEKDASDEIDWSSLKREDIDSLFEDELVEKVASAPEKVGPTLPLPHKRAIRQQLQED